MFRKPNTPGRKRKWEVDPGDLPAERIMKKYEGFRGVAENPAFRLLKLKPWWSRKFTDSEWELFRHAGVSAGQIFDALMAINKKRSRPILAWNPLAHAMLLTELKLLNKRYGKFGGYLCGRYYIFMFEILGCIIITALTIEAVVPSWMSWITSLGGFYELLGISFWSLPGLLLTSIPPRASTYAKWRAKQILRIERILEKTHQ